MDHHVGSVQAQSGFSPPVSWPDSRLCITERLGHSSGKVAVGDKGPRPDLCTEGPAGAWPHPRGIVQGALPQQWGSALPSVVCLRSVWSAGGVWRRTEDTSLLPFSRGRWSGRWALTPMPCVSLMLHPTDPAQPEQCGIRATSATYSTAHSNARSLTHWARPGLEPMSSWMLVGFSNRWAMMGTPWIFLI